MRGMRGLHRHCKWCGKPFDIDVSKNEGGKLYCCTECRDQSQRQQKRIRQRRDYKKYYKPRKPHETVCKRCGKTFLGRWNQAYCMECLTNGGWKMHKLLSQRSAGINLLEMGVAR